MTFTQQTKKVKDGKIQPCRTVISSVMVTCILADELTLLQTYIMFYSSPRLPDLAYLSAYIPQKSSYSYPLDITKYQQKYTFTH